MTLLSHDIPVHHGLDARLHYPPLPLLLLALFPPLAHGFDVAARDVHRVRYEPIIPLAIFAAGVETAFLPPVSSQVAEESDGADCGGEIEGVDEDAEEDSLVGAGVDDADIAYQLDAAIDGFIVHPVDDGEDVAELDWLGELVAEAVEVEGLSDALKGLVGFEGAESRLGEGGCGLEEGFLGGGGSFWLLCG